MPVELEIPTTRTPKTLPRRMRDFVRYRYREAMDWLRLNVAGRFKHRLWRRGFKFQTAAEDVRLHIGSGRERLPGWVNVDLQTYLEVDIALDVTRGLPCSNAKRVFAEHFLEHLHVDDALQFLIAVHRALDPDGWLRLSTPNLDWVWTNVYRPSVAPKDQGNDDEHQIVSGIHANRAFYGWQHRFLWNRELLERALVATGFKDLRWCRYGESELPDMSHLERHEIYDDDPEMPHVLIVEARQGLSRPEELDRFRGLLQTELLQSLKG